MRLINTEKLTFKEFYTVPLPPYAILSHCWKSPTDEVTLKDVQNQEGIQSSRYDKIVNFSKVAKTAALDWAWIDTCCIDTSSSAELSESINSMWSYYKLAKICIVYLEDVEDIFDLSSSRWWKRGWTLQELLAPPNVVFYDKHWRRLRSKHELAPRIEKITRVPQSVLKDANKIRLCSVAQRLSWAAKRETRRPEDIAYCLLGIFQINMPLLYGERSNAFQRLQREILQKYPDQSLFAWHTSVIGRQPVLATSPDDFQFCSDMVVANGADVGYTDQYPHDRTPPHITNCGIELRADARKLKPKGIVDIDLRHERFLWALTLTALRDGLTIELPCTLILVRSGPARFSYERYGAVHRRTQDMQARLREEYEVGKLERNQLFYLSYDTDLLG